MSHDEADSFENKSPFKLLGQHEELSFGRKVISCESASEELLNLGGGSLLGGHQLRLIGKVYIVLGYGALSKLLQDAEIDVTERALREVPLEIAVAALRPRSSLHLQLIV